MSATEKLDGAMRFALRHELAWWPLMKAGTAKMIALPVPVRFRPWLSLPLPEGLFRQPTDRGWKNEKDGSC